MTRRRRAVVAGAAAAGLTCAHLLADGGWDVRMCDTGGCSPPLVLTPVTVQLLHAVWGAGDDLLRGGLALRERVVCWGLGAMPETVAQPGLVIDGTTLLRRLRARLAAAHPRRVRVVEVALPADPVAPEGRSAERDRPSRRDHDWITALAAEDPQAQVFDATGRRGAVAAALGGAQRQGFGRRRVLAATAALTAREPLDRCWMEAVRDGWVFLAPIAPGRALLQAMAATPDAPEEPEAALERRLAQTRLIASRVAAITTPAARFAAAPERAVPLHGPGWIAVGDAAVAFDPLCGDGTGHGLRGALLATAVVEAVDRGEPPQPCLQHYDARLHEALRTHLHRCERHYATGGDTPEWHAERRRMARARQALEADTAAASAPPSYRLHGRRLVALRTRAVGGAGGARIPAAS